MTDDLRERIAKMKQAAEKVENAADITLPDSDYFAAVNNFQLQCGAAAVSALIAEVERLADAKQVVDDYIAECERKLRSSNTPDRGAWLHRQQGALEIMERLRQVAQRPPERTGVGDDCESVLHLW